MMRVYRNCFNFPRIFNYIHIQTICWTTRRGWFYGRQKGYTRVKVDSTVAMRWIMQALYKPTFWGLFHVLWPRGIQYQIMFMPMSWISTTKNYHWILRTIALKHSLAFPLRYLFHTFVSLQAQTWCTISFFNQGKLPPNGLSTQRTELQSKVNFKVVFLVLSTPWRMESVKETDFKKCTSSQLRWLDDWTNPPRHRGRFLFPRGKDHNHLLYNYTTYKVDGATPMYWFIIAPY